MTKSIVTAVSTICLIVAFCVASTRIANADDKAQSAAKDSGLSEKDLLKRLQELDKELPTKPAIKVSAKSGPQGSFIGPDACGKEYTVVHALVNGIRIAVSGGIVVNAPAETGDYTFYVYIKSTDPSGRVVLEHFNRKTRSVGDAMVDFGVIDTHKGCYDPGTTFTLIASLASISPSGKFEVHQQTTCTYKIEP